MPTVSQREYDYMDEALFGRIKRVPDISFTTSDTHVIARLQRQFAKGEPLSVNLQGWHGKAYVLKLTPHFSADGLNTCDATLRPTGRPCSRPDALRIPADQVTVGPERAYDKFIITGLPTPPAGTITQRIYGKSFTQSIMDEVAKGVSASIMSDMKRRVPFDTGALRRAADDLLIHGHPNCRCVPVGITAKENPVRVRNKFYVAAPSVTTHSEQDQDNTEKTVHLAVSSGDRSGKWTRKDLAAAVAHAQQVLEADPSKDHVAVVKIVKIIRRPKPKYIVEDVK
jgi:hypothetical protein